MREFIMVIKTRYYILVVLLAVFLLAGGIAKVSYELHQKLDIERSPIFEVDFIGVIYEPRK